MSRRDYPVADRYQERETDFYRRPRRDREYEDLEVDITRARYDEPRRTETIVRERDVIDRTSRQPDFLREDYGKAANAQLVVREERRDDEAYTRGSVRSRAPTERFVERDEYILQERDRSDRGLPYPRSQRSELEFKEKDKEEIIYRDRARSRAPPVERTDEEIDIKIRRGENERSQPPPPRSEVRERDVDEIRFRRGPGDRPSGSRVVEKEEIDIRESRSRGPPPSRSTKEDIEIDIKERRSGGGRREVFKEEIDIRESSRPPPPRQRSMSRGALVARKEEEWVVRRPRTPPKKDFEEQEIIIRRRETSPEPEPPREPTPEPAPPPPPVLEPIYRPPIIQEVITHHRHIDHGVERAPRTPSPPPRPPTPPREENLEIEIKRKGVRNGKKFEEDIIIDTETTERKGREIEERDIEIDLKERSRSRRRSPSLGRRRYDDEVIAEADYYNRRVSSRGYPGEAYNGATKDWGLVDVPPGTERVRMDGAGGGSQEITWQRYNGERRGRFITEDRVYESEFANGYSPPPAPPPVPAPPPPRERTEFKEEIKITETRTESRPPSSRRRRERMWTEVTKDLVIKEAIEEMGYEYDETDDFYYVMEYLRYEDVVRLVEVTEDIRRERAERIRELQWERERAERAPKMLQGPPPMPPPPRSAYDERIYEREFIVDRDSRGRRYR